MHRLRAAALLLIAPLLALVACNSQPQPPQPAAAPAPAVASGNDVVLLSLSSSGDWEAHHAIATNQDVVFHAEGPFSITL